MLLAAGGAAVEVGPQPGDRGVGVGARELELDIAVELVEADVAADLGLRRAEQPLEAWSDLGLFITSPPAARRREPASSRCRRSFRRASCSVL